MARRSVRRDEARATCASAPSTRGSRGRSPRGEVYVTDPGNAGVTGLAARNVTAWDDSIIATLGLEQVAFPSIADSAGATGTASALPGAPPIVAIVGDQQASLAGQACVNAGDAKITFGTGGMLDVNLGERKRPSSSAAHPRARFRSPRGASRVERRGEPKR